MTNKKLFWSSVNHSSIYHPEPSRKNFYKALLNQKKKNDSLFDSFLSTAFERTINGEHLENLISHVFEYFFFKNIITDDNLKNFSEFTVRDWENAINLILSTEKYRAIALTLIRKNVTQTNIYQRYISVKAYLGLISERGSVDILDIGCGLNFGLLGLTNDKKFDPVVDKTKEKYFSKLVNKKISINSGVGLDKFDPEKNLEWILTCSFYPSEIAGYNKLKSDYFVYKNKTKNVRVLTEDITKLEWNTLNNSGTEFDVIIANMILYQLTRKEKESFFQDALSILKPEGTIIVNEFANIIDGQIKWNNGNFKPNRFRTLVIPRIGEPKEFLKWDSTRCREVSPGKHFNKIISTMENQV